MQLDGQNVAGTINKISLAASTGIFTTKRTFISWIQGVVVLGDKFISELKPKYFGTKTKGEKTWSDLQRIPQWIAQQTGTIVYEAPSQFDRYTTCEPFTWRAIFR